MSSFYEYEEDDELDIRVRPERSAAPSIYTEHRYRPAPRSYYEEDVSSYYVPGLGGHQFSFSPLPESIFINNTIYNGYEDDETPRLRGLSPSPSLSQKAPVAFTAKRSAELGIQRPSSANDIAEFSQDTQSFGRDQLSLKILQKFGIPHHFDPEASVRVTISIPFLL